MQSAPIPLDEARRLSALRALALLDTPAEERFDRITRLALRLFEVSSATIALVDETREWIKSSAGFPHPQLARDVSFAAHAIAEGELLVVEDTVSDARFYDHPLVIGDPRVRFYAGEPLHAEDSSLTAVLSIYDGAPRRFSAGDRQALADLAAIAERELQLTGLSASQLEAVASGSRDLPRVDPLTRLWNRSAMFDIIRRELRLAKSERAPVGLLLIDVDHLRDINEQIGHATGDWILCEVARVLRISLRPYDVIARFGGEEFAAFLTGIDATNAVDAADRIRMSIGRELRASMGRDVSVTIGVATAAAAAAEPESLVRSAQSALWMAKKHGGNSVSIISDADEVPSRVEQGELG